MTVALSAKHFEVSWLPVNTLSTRCWRDHGILIFNQLKAHSDLHVARELAAAHMGLKQATNALKVATWWLGIITLLLGVVELWKAFKGH